MSTMKPGETKKFDCTHCSVEFELCFEPKARSNPASAAEMDSSDAYVCPFCGAQSLEWEEPIEDYPDISLKTRRKKSVGEATPRGGKNGKK